MLKEEKKLQYFTSIIGDKNVDVVLKNGITKEIFSYVYQECLKDIDKIELDRLESTQQGIKKLVNKKLKELQKRGVCEEVIFYYGQKVGTTFKPELHNTVIFTNRTVIIYHKSVDSTKGILSYSIPYNNIRLIEYDSDSDSMVIKLYRNTERAPVISHCKETYTILSHINELNRTIRITSGMFDCMYVSEEYEKPLTRLRESIGSHSFDMLAEMNHKLKKEYSLLRNKFNINIDKCGFGIPYIARTGPGEEDRCPGFIAFDISKKHFYWSQLHRDEKDILHTIELNTIRNAWVEDNVVYINYHYNDVDEIRTTNFAKDILASLEAFVPSSNTWHKAHAFNGKLAKELDIERIKRSLSLGSYEDSFSEMRACAEAAGMNDFDLIKYSRDKVDNRILAAYIWDLHLSSKIDEELFWIYWDLLLNGDKTDYNLYDLYEYKTVNRKRFVRMEDEMAKMAIAIFDHSIREFVRNEVRAAYGTKSVIYTYKDQDAYYFTDNETFESIPVKPFYLGPLASKIVESTRCTLYLYENEVVLVR